MLIVVGAYIRPRISASETELHVVNDLILDNCEYFMQKYKSAGLIIYGDFNDFPTNELENSLNLSHVVGFPTRHDATLDKVMTNVPSYFGKAKKLPLLSSAKHNVILAEQPRPFMRQKIASKG